MKKLNDVNWVVIVKLDVKGKDVYLLEMTREDPGQPWLVRGFPSEAEALGYYERGYDAKHLQSYEGSMSACIHFLFFHPSIIRVTGGEEGLKKLVPGEPVLQKYHSISGWITGLAVDPSIAVTLWERGKKPNLFDQARFNNAHEEREKEERLRRYEI